MILLFALVGCATSEPVVAVTVRGTSLQIGSTVESTLITDDSDPWPRIVSELVASRTPSRPLFLDSVLPAQPPATVARIDAAPDTSSDGLLAVTGAAKSAGFDRVDLSVEGAAPVTLWEREAGDRPIVAGPDTEVVLEVDRDGTGFVIDGYAVFYSVGTDGGPSPSCDAMFQRADLVGACVASDRAEPRRCLTAHRVPDVSALRDAVAAFVRTYDEGGRRAWSLSSQIDPFPASIIAPSLGGLGDAGVRPQAVTSTGPLDSRFADPCLSDDADLDLAEARAWGFLRR